MRQKSENGDSLLISYLSLRKAVGIIGVSLPVVLLLGNWLVFGCTRLEDSISYYYYSGMRGVLVGSLWAIGVFLLSYRGYDTRDQMAGRLACFFALGVALFPTAPARGTCDVVHLVRFDHSGCDAIHAVSLFHANVRHSLVSHTGVFFTLSVHPDASRPRTGDDEEEARKKHRVLHMRLDHRRFHCCNADTACGAAPRSMGANPCLVSFRVGNCHCLRCFMAHQGRVRP